MDVRGGVLPIEQVTAKKSSGVVVPVESIDRVQPPPRIRGLPTVGEHSVKQVGCPSVPDESQVGDTVTQLPQRRVSRAARDSVLGICCIEGRDVRRVRLMSACNTITDRVSVNAFARGPIRVGYKARPSNLAISVLSLAFEFHEPTDRFSAEAVPQKSYQVGGRPNSFSDKLYAALNGLLFTGTERAVLWIGRAYAGWVVDVPTENVLTGTQLGRDAGQHVVSRTRSLAGSTQSKHSQHGLTDRLVVVRNDDEKILREDNPLGESQTEHKHLSAPLVDSVVTVTDFKLRGRVRALV